MDFSALCGPCPKKGAAGIDRQTIADVEAYGIAKLLDGLAADLKDGSYRYRLGVSWRGHDLTGLGAPDGQRRFGYLAV
jgi:hypothetical protein